MISLTKYIKTFKFVSKYLLFLLNFFEVFFIILLCQQKHRQVRKNILNYWGKFKAINQSVIIHLNIKSLIVPFQSIFFNTK